MAEREDKPCSNTKSSCSIRAGGAAQRQYAALLQEQLGGANGELKAAMQYLSQSFRIRDPEIKDLFLDIAAEELGHMEMVAQTIHLLNGHEVDAESVPRWRNSDPRAAGPEPGTHQRLRVTPGPGIM